MRLECQQINIGCLIMYYVLIVLHTVVYELSVYGLY